MSLIGRALRIAGICAVVCALAHPGAAQTDGTRDAVTDLEAAVAEASTLVEQGQYAEAIERLGALEADKALERSPELLVRVRFLLGKALDRDGRPIEAVAVFARLLGMPKAPPPARGAVQARVDAIVKALVKQSVGHVRDGQAADAIRILEPLEGAGREVMGQDDLAGLRYALGKAFAADGQPLLAVSAYVQCVLMPETPPQIRSQLRDQLDRLLDVEATEALLARVEPERAVRTLEALEPTLFGEPRYLAGTRSALARAHVQRRAPRAALLTLKRTVAELPPEMDRELAVLNSRATALVDHYFGTIQVLCPPEETRTVQVSIHGPVGDDDTPAETITGPCSTDLHQVVDGAYVVTAYSTDLVSVFAEQRHDVPVEPGRKLRVQLTVERDEGGSTLGPWLVVGAVGSLIAGVIVHASAADVTSGEGYWADNVLDYTRGRGALDSERFVLSRESEAEVFSTALAATFYTASATLLLWGIVEWAGGGGGADAPGVSVGGVDVGPGSIRLRW